MAISKRTSTSRKTATRRSKTGVKTKRAKPTARKTSAKRKSAKPYGVVGAKPSGDQFSEIALGVFRSGVLSALKGFGQRGIPVTIQTDAGLIRGIPKVLAGGRVELVGPISLRAARKNHFR